MPAAVRVIHAPEAPEVECRRADLNEEPAVLRLTRMRVWLDCEYFVFHRKRDANQATRANARIGSLLFAMTGAGHWLTSGVSQVIQRRVTNELPLGMIRLLFGV